MSNELKLESPYSNNWKKGYLVKDVDGRTKVVLYNNNKDRSTTLYSRYLMSIYLDRYLRQDEVVDHIDEDRFNDTIENLQILTVSENNVKNMKFRGGKKLVNINCPYCGVRFTRKHNQSHFVKPKKYDFCSRNCIGSSKNGKYIYFSMNPYIFREYE